MATTPPGWYDDGRGALRWWDGAQWSEHVQTPDPEPAVAEAPVEADSAVSEAQVEPAAAEAPVEPAAAEAPVEPEETLPPELAPEGDYPPSAPPGYPGGFPGGAAPSGAFIAATEPKKSKLWILWVVLGVVLLGIVGLVAILIPVIIGLFGSVANGGSGSASEDEAAAVAAVEMYDEAWATADCDKYFESTTADFREVIQYSDCDSFTAASQGFTDSVDDYLLTVESVESGEDQITVVTTETFTSLFDEDGNPTEEPVAYEENYSYVVVPADGGWAINEVGDLG